MIDEFTIFHRGGLVLWSHKLTAVIGRPIDTVIQTVLLLDRQSQAQYKNEKYTVKWTFANDVELIFVAVYLNMSNALYVDALMDAVKNEFVAMYKAAIAQEKKRQSSTSKPAHVDFDASYKRLLRAAMESTMQKRQQRPFDPNRKSKQRGGDAADNDGDDDAANDDGARDTINETKTNDSHVTDNGAVTTVDSSAPSDTTPTSGVNMDKLKALQLAAARGQVRQMRTGPPSKKKNASADTTPTKKTKQPTKWADGKMSKADIRNLDYSAKDGAESSAVQQYNAMGDGEEATKANFSDDEDDVDDEGDADTTEKASSTSAATTSSGNSTNNSGLFGFFKGLVGLNELSRQDLEPILTQFKSSLMAKNVAQEIAEKLCESVCVTLMGKKLQSFTTIKTTVRNSIEEALTRILTPDRQVDVLQGIAAAQAEKRPYSIVFLGVNGVGKCFAKDTQLMTYDGRAVHAQSVTYETVLMGDDSTPRHITPGSLVRGNAPLYQIIPESPLVNAHTVNGHHIMCLIVNEQPVITEQADHQYIVSHWQQTQKIPVYTQSTPFAIRTAAEDYKNLLVNTLPIYYEVEVNDWLNNKFISEQLKRASFMYKPSSIMYDADRNGQSTLAQMAATFTSIELTSTQVCELAWLIGLWLNNPHEKPTIIINHSADQEMLIERCHRATDMLTLPLVQVTTNDRHTELDVGGYDGVFGHILEKLNMTKEQRIPHALLTDTLTVRTQLLDGLSSQQIRNDKVFNLCTTSLTYLDDIKRLALSLGHSAFTTDKCVCRIKCRDSTSTVNSWTFNVDCVGAGDYYGFSVDGNSRFLLYDFTVTHNSTSLAKTCAYFRSKGLTVGIGACDTFRAGAIEQLRTHANALNVTLYAKGYDRDAAAVCSEAISSARKDGLDVILIDTAGRMQDNEPLMRALSKLIHINKPDLILFVGEALVGNDAVDQASKFNRCLSDLSGDFEPRLIDGIILTKFDTIDDKVGAAISMAYTTGRPIMFVGTGQTYTDLKRMSAKTLIRALLK